MRAGVRGHPGLQGFLPSKEALALGEPGYAATPAHMEHPKLLRGFASSLSLIPLPGILFWISIAENGYVAVRRDYQLKTIRAVSAITLSLVALSAVAQETVRSVATRSPHAVKSSPIRTQDFYPKIDATYSPYLAEPENPMGRLEVGPTNNLKPGGLLKESRGAKKSNFPAIRLTGC